MRLSEEIYKGAQMVPPTTGRMFEWDADRLHPTAACVVGAALLGAGIEVSPTTSHPSNHFPEMREYVPHPVCFMDVPHLQVVDVIVELNDFYKWTREEIADWLRKLEK